MKQAIKYVFVIIILGLIVGCAKSESQNNLSWKGWLVVVALMIAAGVVGDIIRRRDEKKHNYRKKAAPDYRDQLQSLPVHKPDQESTFYEDASVIVESDYANTLFVVQHFLNDPREWLAGMGRYSMSPLTASAKNEMEVSDGMLLVRHSTLVPMGMDVEILWIAHTEPDSYLIRVGKDSIDWFEQFYAFEQPEALKVNPVNYRPTRNGPNLFTE